MDTQEESAAPTQPTDARVEFWRRRAEYHRRIAEIRGRAAKFDPNSTPEMKALRKSNEEYRERIRAITRRLARG